MEDRELSERHALINALDRLEFLTRQVKRQGQMLATMTIMTVAASLSLAFYRLFGVLYIAVQATAIVIAGSAFFSLLVAVLFESRRKEGDVLFKEISDELQWYVRFSRKESSESAASAPERRPELAARVVLRSFAQSSDLPLVPGKFGPLIYATINVASVAFSAASLLPVFSKF